LQIEACRLKIERIVDWDCRLGLAIGIDDWDWRLELTIGTGDWDCWLAIGIQAPHAGRSVVNLNPLIFNLNPLIFNP
jgi:hypothetical protein